MGLLHTQQVSMPGRRAHWILVFKELLFRIRGHHTPNSGRMSTRLVGQARAKGVPVDTYVEKLVEKDAGETAKSQKAPAGIRERLTQLAFSAHRSFEKGMGHPAQLNILDCCTYGRGGYILI